MPATQKTSVSPAAGAWSKVAWTMTAFCDAAVTTPTGLSGPAATPMKVGAGEPVVSLVDLGRWPVATCSRPAFVTNAVTASLPSASCDASPIDTVADVSPALCVAVSVTVVLPVGELHGDDVARRRPDR